MSVAPLRRAFTLIELLVVIAIISVLIGLLLPAVQKVRESAARIKCQNNMKQMALAMHLYHDSMGVLPFGVLPAAQAPNLLGFHVYILPYMDQQDLYNKFDFAQPYDGVINLALGLIKVPIYQCPTSRQPYTQYGSPEWVNGTEITHTMHYYGVAGPMGKNPQTNAPYTFNTPTLNTPDQGSEATQGLIGMERQIALTNVLDGTSNTLMLGEMSWFNANYYRVWPRGTYDDDENRDTTCCRNVANAINSTPYNGNDHANDTSFGSDHTGNGANFAMADGSIRWISASIALPVYFSIASYNGGEEIPPF